MFPDFSELKYKLQRKAALLAEDFDIFEYINKQPIEVINEPFPHIVVDNFFKEDFLAQLEKFHKQKYENGSFTNLEGFKGKFTVEGYSPAPSENSILDLFYSVGWNNYFAEIFKKQTNLLTLFALHHHKVGDKTSHAHTDFIHDSFLESSRLSNGVIYKKKKLLETNNQDISLVGGVRIIALVMYIFNDDWKEEDAGRTLLYKAPIGDIKKIISSPTKEVARGNGEELYDKMQKSTPIKKIEPLRNRILAFEVSLGGYHAVEENNTPRSTVTQWFYGDPSKNIGYTFNDR
jgi:hypothetical protein